MTENNIPSHWQIKKLGEVCQIQTGKFDANHAKDKGKYRFYTCAFEHMYCDTNRFSGECLILPGNGANVGEVFYYNGEFDAYQRTYVINDIKTSPKYLYYHLLCYWKKRNQDKQFGSATNYIRIGNFNDYIVSIPPLSEQHTIVSKIEELLSDLDNGVQQLRTAAQQLKVYRQSLLKAAFEGRLTSTSLSDRKNSSLSEVEAKDGELPKGWKWVKIGDFISKIEAGKSFKCDERTPDINEIGVLKVSAVTWGTYNELESKTIIEKERYNQAYIVKDGDFLFSRANTLDLIGAAVIAGKTHRQLMLSDKTLRFIFNDQINKYYALYYLRSQKGRKEIQRLSTGNQESMRNIGQARINQIEISIPPTLIEQCKIVEILESKLTVCDKIEETITQGLQQAETLRQSILKKAFEGRLIKPQPAQVVAKPKNEYFYQMQLLALIAKASKQHSIEHGEMTLAKYAYLLDKVYSIPTYYDYNRWHLGPYPPEMKKAINNKQYFARKVNHIMVVNEDKLLKYTNPYETNVIDAIDDLASIFEKYPVKERADKTELLATVCKVVEDIKTVDITEVRKSMQGWKIELDNCPFKNKAEKFSIEETEKCLKFLVQRGWIAKLINKN